MMNNRIPHKYAGISSFKDLRAEKERLELKKRIIETKLDLTYTSFRERLSVANIVISLAREFIVPKISDIINILAKRGGSTSSAEKDIPTEE